MSSLSRNKWRKVRDRFLREQNDFYCAICFKELAQKEVTIDHKVPVSRGGSPYKFKNLQITCLCCNGFKGNKTPEEFEKWKVTKDFERKQTVIEKRKEIKSSPFETFFSSDTPLSTKELETLETDYQGEVIKIFFTDKIIIQMNDRVSNVNREKTLSFINKHQFFKPKIKEKLEAHVVIDEDKLFLRFKRVGSFKLIINEIESKLQYKVKKA